MGLLVPQRNTFIALLFCPDLAVPGNQGPATVLARITPEGLKLLARLDEPLQEAHRKQFGDLGRDAYGR